MKKVALKQLIKESLTEQAAANQSALNQASLSMADATTGTYNVVNQFGDAGTFNFSAWYGGFINKAKSPSRANRCNFVKNQFNTLANKIPNAGPKYRTQMFMKMNFMIELASKAGNQMLSVGNTGGIGCGAVQVAQMQATFDSLIGNPAYSNITQTDIQQAINEIAKYEENMKKQELRQLIRKIIKEGATDQFGGISGFSDTTDAQTFSNIAGPAGLSYADNSGGQLPATQAYLDFIAANPGVEGQYGDAGTFNGGVWFNNFMAKVSAAQNPCNFLTNQSNKLSNKYSAAGGKYKAQLHIKITMMAFIAQAQGCGVLPAQQNLPIPTFNQ